jgi:hypothetical protein
MSFLDSSVLVASLDPDEPDHAAYDALLPAGGHQAWAHALAETFSVLTGGRQFLHLECARFTGPGPAWRSTRVQPGLNP